jgi:colicin import membrane protein
MAERTPSRRRSTRQAMVETVAEAEKAVAQRKEAEAKPEDRIAAKALGEAVAVADALSADGVVRLIGDLKSTIARTLTQLSDRLEEEVGKYGQIRRAIAAKEAELKEIYEIQKSASTLAAMLETYDRKQEELEREFQTEKEQLDREIETTRADWETARVEWETEKKQHDQEIKDRDAAEQKRRQRE